MCRVYDVHDLREGTRTASEDEEEDLRLALCEMTCALLIMWWSIPIGGSSGHCAGNRFNFRLKISQIRQRGWEEEMIR